MPSLNEAEFDHADIDERPAVLQGGPAGASAGQPPDPATSLADTTDRRRPGRLRVTNPHLIPVLRGGANAEEAEIGGVSPEFLDDQTDDLSAARGVMVGLLLAVPIWCALIIGVSRILR